MPIDLKNIDWSKVPVLSDESLDAPAAVKPHSTPGDRLKPSAQTKTSQNWLKYANQGAIRSQPISPKLTNAMSFLPELGVSMEVFSGGQQAKGSGGRRVGSTRHDHGDAGDVFFYKDGRRLDWSRESDRPIFVEIVRRARANGVTGIGAGPGYMRPGSMHIGFGKEAVWGAGGKGTNAPDWLRAAFGSPGQAGNMAVASADFANEPVPVPQSKGLPPTDMSTLEWDTVPVIGADGSVSRPESTIVSHQKTEDTASAPDLETRFEQLESESPGRYQVIPEDQYETWKADWDAENQSTGFAGDTVRLLQAGFDGLGLGVREAVKAIPKVGNGIVDGMDAIDEWMNGKTSDVLLGERIEKSVVTLTPGTRLARGKQWWDGERNRPGAAWLDPRSYYSGVVESLPGMVVTMGPSLSLAKGAYVSAIAAGSTERVAAAAAARTALVAGAVSEGIVGGGQAAVSVRDQIAQMPQQALQDSAAVQRLMEDSGLSLEEAIEAISDDAATQAFVIAGVGTGVFGGFGDRVLAKILAEGVGGNIAQRITQGAIREGFAEGVLEEAPQEAISQLGENIALKDTVDPDRDLSEGVANAAAGGVAVGGAMGVGLGAAGGAMSPREGEVAREDEGFTPDRTLKKGVLAESLEHGERRAGEAAGAAFIIADPAIGNEPAGELDGVSVRLAPDQTGIRDGARRIVLPDGRTHVIGERLLKPTTSTATAEQTVDDPGQIADASGAPIESVPDGAPATGTDVRLQLPDGESVMARVEGYADGEAIVMDVGTGEVLQVPLDALELSPAAAVDEPAIVSRDASDGSEPIPADIPGAEPEPTVRTTGDLPPADEAATLFDVPYRTPLPGQRVIVDAEGIERFSGTVQSYEEDASEALVRRDDGSDVQVPVSDLRVSKLSDEQIEDQKLAEDPPVERETITGSNPTAREVIGKQVILPDDTHARLFDLGKLRRDSKRISGASTLDMDRVNPSEQNKLATELGVSPHNLGQLADDYRYRVERSAKRAQTRTPFKIHPVNEKLLERMRKERGNEPDAPFPEQDTVSETLSEIAKTWDTLPVDSRKAVLQAAKVKHPASTRWADFSANIQKKLEATQQVSTQDTAVPEKQPVSLDEAAQEAATSPQNDLPEPSQAQKEAGNYKKGHVSIGGFDIAIENPKGSDRSGVDRDGKPWSITMKSHYGYFKGTIGRDKDHIDTFLHPNTQNLADTDPVFVIDQVDPDTKRFDEHKVMLGYKKREQARRAYMANYTRGWKGLGTIIETNVRELKDWFASGNTTKPFAKRELEPSRAERVERELVSMDDASMPLATDTPAAVRFLIQRTDGSDERMANLVSSKPTNAQLLAEFAEAHGGSGTSLSRGNITARGTSVEILRPDAEGNAERTTIKNKQLAEAIRAAYVTKQPERNATSAPEHLANEGKPLDLENRYEATAAGNPATTTDGSLDPREEAEAADIPYLSLEQFREVTDDWARLFQDTDKKDKRVVEREVRGKPYLSPAEAKAEVQSWKDHVKNQFDADRSQNADKTILSLFDFTGEWSKPWREAGYNVIQMDIQNGHDVHDFSVEYFNENWDFSDVYGILAACPCTDFASSGARHFAAKDVDGRTEASKELVHQTLRTIEYFRPWGFWALENPVGRIQKLTGLPDWRMSFHPSHFGEDYTKKTILWGDFNAHAMPLANADPSQGSKMWAKYGGKSMATKNARSATPEGFAYSFFMGNNYVDAEPAFILPRRYPDASGAIKAALKAGMDPKSVEDLMAETYEYDEAEAARSALLKEVKALRGGAPSATSKQIESDIRDPKRKLESKTNYWPEENNDMRVTRYEPDPGESQEAYELSQIANSTLMHYAKVYGVPFEGRTREDVWSDMRAKGAKSRQIGSIIASDLDPKEVPGLIKNAFHVGSGDTIEAPKRLFNDFVDALRANADRIEQRENWSFTISAPVGDQTGRLELANYGPDGVRINTYSTQNKDAGYGGTVMGGMANRKHITAFLKAFIASAANKPEKTKPAKTDGKSQFAGNKLFTEDKVKAARKRLRAKLNQVNSGLDPEVLVDGMTIAGAYIEAGVRKFPDYAKAMISDLGPSVRPFLLSFYEGARNYPGLETGGMDTVEDARNAFDAIMAKPGISDKALTQAQNAQTLLESTGSKPAAETIDDNTSPGKTNDRKRSERKSKTRVPSNAEGAETLDLFGQPDKSVERKSQSSPESGDRGRENRDQPAVSGKPAESPATAEQRVPERRGNRDGTGSRANRQPEPKSRDYRIGKGELTREGSWRVTGERNVEIVELIKTLEKEGREATADERKLMVQFTGWGASEIANGIFPTRAGVYKQGWEALGERLKKALTDEEYKTAARSTQYAHYTSEAVIRSIYDGLKRIGVSGGRVLEPGMGTGHFRGLMPDNMANTSQYTGIEFDGVTAGIAKHLYPDSRITHGDYTKTKLPKNYFDVAIGNPPFASIKVTDDPEYRKHGFSLHDYFFAKTIDRVKPGGVMVFVTSRYTLDKVRDAGRRYLADSANLLGAIRLPQTAFKANAGTEVVTDVLFLQKRGPGIEDNGIRWTSTKDIAVGEDTFTVNEYIADHPEMVLGDHAATGSMYRSNEYTVTPDTKKDIEKAFADAVLNLPDSVFKPERGSTAEAAKVIEKDFDPKAKKEGGLYLSDDGDLMIRQDGVGQAFTDRQTSTGKLKPLSARETKFLKDFVALRDAIKQTQFDQLTDGDWESSLEAARTSYREMVDRNGKILAYSTIERTDKDGNVTSSKRFKNEPLFMIDPDGPLAFTLEKITESGDIVEGPIFGGRVLNKPTDPEIVTTQDAMFVSLDKLGKFDLADVARRAQRTEEQTVEDLGTSIYEDPGDGWQLADAYLSGNVVQRLTEARAAAEMDEKYQRNVDALLAVQPRPLDASEIDVKLGAPWLPADDIKAFSREILGQEMKVRHNLKVGTWQVEGNKSTIGEFAMDNLPTADILNKILNNSQLRVTRPVQTASGKTSTETDPDATEKLNDIARKIRERFRAWLWSDTDRVKRLVNFYNDNYNNIAPRQFDGSHLTLPGTSLRFNLHPHQKRSIWRAIQTGDTYLAHAVGAGKTFEMIAIGMEERRLGLSRKPLYVVPNHMLGQFQREFLELYPAANIMVADEKNFHTSNRRRFIAQAALNDPDAIIITHSAFGRIGLSDETNDKQINNLIEEWKELQEEIEASEGKGLSFKRTQSQIERLEKRLQGKQKRESKDAVMTFEELGVDRLIIDEMHEFRKLDFVTNQGSIKGIDPQGSQRAMDLFSKVTYLRETNADPDRVLVGASGTPVTNTMGELFTVQRFFQPGILEDIGAHNFDAWSAQFGDVVEGLEQNAAGKFETVSRFARFQNVPELMRRVRSFMDILTSSALGELVERPTRVNPPREIKTTPTPEGYKAYQERLNQRINAIRNRKGPPKKGDDIILKVIADGRFSAIDMRFVDSKGESDPNSKLNQLIDDVIADYKATADREYLGLNGVKDPSKGSTLVVFADIGLGDAVVSSRGFDMKAWIETRLTSAGIPKDQFAFIRDHKAHAKKERLFADLREGKKRILIGGKDMETGVNVQKRLTHLYHLDAPWFPASVEQREGRADRQGNQNEDIVIRAYATKGSYDSTMWSMNARKARFIEQALNGDDSVRKMEDVSEASAFEMAAALSSGDPRYLQLAGLRQEVDRLGRLRKAHYDEQNRYKREEHYEESNITRFKKQRLEFEEAVQRGHRITAGKFSAAAGSKTLDKRDDWSKTVYAAFLADAEKRKDGAFKLGEIGGHDVKYFGVSFEDGSHKASLAVDLPGDMADLAEFPTTEDVTVAGIGQRAVNQVNSIFDKTGELADKIERAGRRLKQIRSQVGAPFAEEALYLEKQAELSELELELQNEKGDGAATEADKAGSAKDIVEAKESSADTPGRKYSRNSEDSQASVPGERSRVISELRNNPVNSFLRRLIENGSVKIVDRKPADVPDNVQAWTDPDGTITLSAPDIAAGTASGVLLHEAFHAGQDALKTRKVWQSLEKRLAALYRQHERSSGKARVFFDTARDSITETGDLAVEEFGAYAIEAYENAPKTMQRWVDDLLGALKAWVLKRFRRQIGKVTPAELRALALSALRDSAKGHSPSFSTGRGRRYSRKVRGQEIKDQIGGRWTDLSPKLLSLVPLNYFEEMRRPGMTAIDRYLKVKRSMDSYRSEKHDAMDAVAQKWRKFASANRQAASELASLMHESTSASIDPSVVPDGPRPIGYNKLRARFEALPAVARALYKTVRNSYARMQKEIDQLILQNVEKTQKINEKEAKNRYDAARAKVEKDPTLKEPDRREKLEALASRFKADMTKSRWAAKARMTRLRLTFEKNRVPAPYFPLARFGEYFVTVRDMAGDVVSFSRFESDADRRRWMRANRREIENEFPGVVFEQGVLGNSADIRQSMDPRMLAEIDGILKDSGIDQEVMDAIYQKWLQAMPDLSIRKRYIHRKGTAGFHQDALRAFASHMFHGGHQMGKLKYGIDLQEAVDDARDQARRSDDPTRAGQLVNELGLRHDWVMNPKGSKFAQKVNSAAFVWYLAATPAAALVNMTQPILFGIPVLGAKLGGLPKASAALMKASTDLLYGKGNISNGRLSGDEKRAIEEMYKSGAIDRTMAMDIAGIGDSGVSYSPLRHKVMTKISWMFHRAEVINREVTALAAYRLARAQGQRHEQAVDTAHTLNFTVNYDYANSSRPRVLQTDFAKVVGVFMSYQINVWYRIFRDIHQSFAGDTPQARKEARYQLAGLAGMQALMGGTSGFFMYNVLMTVAGLFFDDEDNPFTFKAEAEKAIFDLFGPEVGGMIINGVPGHLAGINLTSRIGMADFFLRMPEGSKEGRDWWMEFVAGSLGASVGAVGNAVVGAHYISEGDTARGLELMSPKAVKDLMKTWRYANEGLLTRKGDIILPREDIDAWNLVAQASGFAPAEVATAHKLRGRKYEAQNTIKEERSELINRFATAVRNGDTEARRRVIQQIKAWNKRSYAKTLPITRETLQRSLKTRARLKARRQDGFLPINDKVGLYLEQRTPVNPYR